MSTDVRMADQPIDMVLPCPRCGQLHVDAPEPATGWTNPPHKSHLCHNCGLVWRPADVPTNGVAATRTRGERDTPIDDAVTAVWTDEQVFALNAHQHRGDLHPYTCGNDSRHRPLIATPHGWRCADCDYRQTWAHGVPSLAPGGPS